MAQASQPDRMPGVAGNPVVLDFEFFGEGAEFHHIGLAVGSIREVSPDAEAVPDETQKVLMAFVRLHGIRIELLEPTSEDSPITRNLRQGVKLLHICYEVPDVDAAVESCRPHGFHRLRSAQPAPGYEGRRVAWLFSKQYGLFELLERER